MLKLSIGEKIAVLRKRHKMSQKELAEALGINVSNIFNYEDDRYKPNIDLLIKISDLFSVSLDELIKP